MGGWGRQRPWSTRPCDGVVVLGRDHGLDAPPERPAGSAAAVLGSRHRDRPDPATPRPSPAAPGRRVPARPVREEAPRPLRPRRDDALPAPSATGPERRGPPGLSSVGAGEWAAAKHGGRRRRGWRKLSRRVDQSGVIRVHTLTEATGDEATTASIYSPRSMALSCASPLTLPLTRSPSTKRRGVRRSLSHRPARRPSLATPRGRPRGNGRSRWRRRSAGVAGSRRQGALVRAGWRTRASATRPSLAMAFAPGVQRGRGVRLSSAVRS